jgi:hypothetical protein
MYKICLINTLSFLWSLIMFFDEPTDLMGRMSTTITLFLAAVAFLFVVNDKLPKVRTSHWTSSSLTHGCCRSYTARLADTTNLVHRIFIARQIPPA